MAELLESFVWVLSSSFPHLTQIPNLSHIAFPQLRRTASFLPFIPVSNITFLERLYDLINWWFWHSLLHSCVTHIWNHLLICVLPCGLASPLMYRHRNLWTGSYLSFSVSPMPGEDLGLSRYSVDIYWAMLAQDFEISLSAVDNDSISGKKVRLMTVKSEQGQWSSGKGWVPQVSSTRIPAVLRSSQLQLRKGNRRS